MKIRKSLLATALLLATCSAALSQSNIPVIEPGGCGNANFANGFGYYTLDTAGRNCGASSPASLGWFGFTNITGQGTTLVKSGPGLLHNVTFNFPTATEVLTIFDSLTGSGTKIATITIPASPAIVTVSYDVNFTIGLTIVTSVASSDVTVSFK